MVKKQKMCKLTKEENKFWEHTFEYYVDHGLSPSRADKRTFTELSKKFPRLKKCEKIK